MNAFYAGGVGLWTPGYLSLEAWLAGVPDPAVVAPRAELLPPTLRRRATSLSHMVATAAAQAAGQAGADLSRVPLLLGSAIGEAAALAMLEELQSGEGLPSPTRFHNSVHNGPAAYVSIATGNHGFSTAIAAGEETAAAALVEAAALLAERGGEVLLVLADEPPATPFQPARPYPPLAVALYLSAAPGPATLATLRGPRRSAGGGPAVRAPFGDHPGAGGLALATAVLSKEAGVVALGPPGPRGWAVDLVPGARP